ncbi:MAG: SAM-dependent methyltransferase [Bdellovibrionia bacterium]
MDLKMDMWKYYGLTHVDHTIMNPMSMVKTQRLIELLRLPKGGRVLDIACGKAEFLCMLAERYGVTGTGVELSPYTFDAAQKNVHTRKLNDQIELLNEDGAKYTVASAMKFDLVSCVGASWIFEGHAGTLKALKNMVRPGGLILVGEPFWKREPDLEYLKVTGTTLELFGSHLGNVKAGEELGLSLLYTVVSNKDDWDNYEGLQWQAAERYALEQPEDPDVEALLHTTRMNRDAYLRCGRECLGWAMYLFQAP